MYKYNFLYPATVMIEPTNICNLNCKMCQARCSMVPDLEKRFMTPEQLRVILDKLKGYITNIVFQGDCESTLSPYLPELCKIAAEYSDSICLVTNGTMLTEGLIERLIVSGVTQFSLSIDDHRPEEYEAIRVGASYADVMENLDALIRIRNQKYPSVYLLIHKVVFQDDTIDDLLDFYQTFMVKHPVDRVTISPEIFWGLVAVEDWAIFRNTLENALLKQGRAVNLRDYENYPYRAVHKYFCGTNLFSVSYQGDLNPCPLHANECNKFGNLLVEDLETIRQKEIFQEFHRFWLEKKYSSPRPAVCDNCYVLNNPYFYYCLDDGVQAINIFTVNEK